MILSISMSVSPNEINFIAFLNSIAVMSPLPSTSNYPKIESIDLPLAFISLFSFSIMSVSHLDYATLPRRSTDGMLWGRRSPVTDLPFLWYAPCGMKITYFPLKSIFENSCKNWFFVNFMLEMSLSLVFKIRLNKSWIWDSYRVRVDSKERTAFEKVVKSMSGLVPIDWKNANADELFAN